MEVEAVVPERALPLEDAAALIRDEPRALAVGPAIAEYRAALEELGVPAQRLSDEPRFPSALSIAALARWGEGFDLDRLFSLEPCYVRASEAERNPKFPPLPGPPPSARLKED
jgi:tRNA threonylcarbamoyladenosine biosynthesis protein TsaB